MPLNPNTLANSLELIGSVTNEPSVINGWGNAFVDYMLESSVIGVSPLNATVFDPCKAAMQLAMVGISTPHAETTLTPAASAIVAGIEAFWDVIATQVPATWVLVPFPLSVLLTKPTGLLTEEAKTAFKSSLDVAFTANVVGQLSASASYSAIASVIQTGNLGATVQHETTPTSTIQNVL